MIRITGALSVRSSHGWSVSCVVPVPVPVLSLADQTGLGALLGASGSGRRRFDQER
jgi:hypothetical protein